MSKENVEAARKSIEAWNRGDVDAFLKSFHPDGEYVSDVVGQVQSADNVYRGREEIRRFWDEWHSVWDLTIEASEIRDRLRDGRAVAYREYTSKSDALAAAGLEE